MMAESLPLPLKNGIVYLYQYQWSLLTLFLLSLTSYPFVLSFLVGSHCHEAGGDSVTVQTCYLWISAVWWRRGRRERILNQQVRERGLHLHVTFVASRPACNSPQDQDARMQRNERKDLFLLNSWWRHQRRKVTQDSCLLAALRLQIFLFMMTSTRRAGKEARNCGVRRDHLDPVDWSSLLSLPSYFNSLPSQCQERRGGRDIENANCWP
jgi:hypothetical protein